MANSAPPFQIPDYTAYNEMLSLFRNFSAIPIPLSQQDGYHMHPDKIAEEIARGTSVILTSNPRNPTGQVLTNPELGQIQDICKFSRPVSKSAKVNDSVPQAEIVRP
jgi:aspartate/methionine/tyrosine aminotransferase